MRKVKLNVSSDDLIVQLGGVFPDRLNNTVEIGYDFDNEEYPYSTLKDVSIVMGEMVGQGVIWELANEISKRIDKTYFNNPYEVSEILSEIFLEYSRLSDSDAFQRSENSPSLYRPMN